MQKTHTSKLVQAQTYWADESAHSQSSAHTHTHSCTHAYTYTESLCHSGIKMHSVSVWPCSLNYPVVSVHSGVQLASD